ncbi:hypothetical protein Bbelb_339720 [Branchiostoma belcheri]|nr:hypothetical protein Bbelb_339720 [Branchiostoma belcheri]
MSDTTSPFSSWLVNGRRTDRSRTKDIVPASTRLLEAAGKSRNWPNREITCRGVGPLERPGCGKLYSPGDQLLWQGKNTGKNAQRKVFRWAEPRRRNSLVNGRRTMPLRLGGWAGYEWERKHVGGHD